MIGGRLDITEREQAELAARRNRQRLELLTETSQVGVWFCDLPFDELVWDHRVKEHFWLPPDARVTIDLFYERLHPEDRERTRAALEAALANKSRYEIDYRTVAPDGREKWIHAIGHPHYDADGQPIRFDGVTMDVTQQKNADEAIRQRTAQFEALLNGAPLGVYLVDADFKIRQVNPIARPTFGDIPDLIGRDFAEVMHRLWQKDYADELVTLFRHTLETGVPYATSHRTEKRRDLGVTEYYEWQINRLPLPDGRHGVVCYFRDISARVAAELKLRESKVEADRQRRLYHTILSNTPDLAYVFDLNHRFTYANDVLLRMWGKSWDEAIGKNCLELGYEPWHAEMHDREIEEVVATKQPVRGEVPFAGTFGRRIYDYILVPVLDADGKVEAVAGTTRDVTERKRAELRNRFLVGLDDALRPLAEPGQIVTTAARLLGEHLQVDRCAYADVEPDADTMNLIGNYLRSPEIKSIVGQLKFADFGAEVLRLMRENLPYVVHDLDTHEPPVADPAAYRATQIQAVICAPLHKAGRFVASMAVHMATSRLWMADEIELVSAVAARCWESIERVRLERGLRESEEQFRAYVTTSSDVVYRMNADWSEMRQLVGHDFLPHASQPNRGWLDTYILPEDQPRVLAAIRKAIRTKSTFELEHRIIRRDGKLGWTLSRAIPLLDGNGDIIEWFGAASDVTERRRAEHALRESEGRYRSLFESIDEGFCVIEMLFDEKQRPVDYLFHEVNPAFEKQAGMHGAIGRRMLEFVSEIEAHWLENYGRVALTGDPIRFAAEYKSLGRWFDVYAFRVGDSQSRRVAVLFTNITEQKLSEIALRESEERARAASVAKDNFLAQLSHELRTPLTPVLMTAAALRDDTSLSASTREAFAMIERNVALEARLIDDLLDLTRVTRGKLSLRTEVCDAHALVGQAVEIVHDEGREKQIRISLDLAASHPQVLGDRARLQQVLWNLLRNAVNFTPQGGRIDISTKDAECASDGAARPGICIKVSDSGVGFDATLAENLFEPFYQGTGSRPAGLGLGLAIARAIVELHHGNISGRSDGAGRGATFTVTLPISADVAAETPEVAGGAPTGKDGQSHPAMRLLVVEDHEATLRVLTTLLSRAGHAVTAAGTIADALKAAREQPFDAVVSDLGLPDGTGLELMERLRAEHGLTGVALSGYGMEQDVRRSRDAGFAAHLVKPVNFEDLRRALESLPRGEKTAAE